MMTKRDFNLCGSYFCELLPHLLERLMFKDDNRACQATAQVALLVVVNKLNGISKYLIFTFKQSRRVSIKK